MASFARCFFLQISAKRSFAPGRAPFCAHKKGRKKRQGVKIQTGFMPCAAVGRHFGNIPHDFHPLDPHLRGISPIAPSTITGARVLHRLSGRPTLLHELSLASPAGCAGEVLLGICCVYRFDENRRTGLPAGVCGRRSTKGSRSANLVGAAAALRVMNVSITLRRSLTTG